MPFIPLFITALAAAGALASPAAAQAAPAAPADAVVPVRHVAVPPPDRARLTPNTAQLVVMRPAPTPASAPAAQATNLPASGTAAAPLVLEQPGLPEAARDEARKNGVPPVLPAATAGAVQPLAAPAAAEAPGGAVAAAPPPPVFQTMQQAAQARTAAPSAAAPALPDTAAPAAPWRELTLARVLPLALLFLVLPVFIQWRKRAKRHAGDDQAA